MNNITPVPTARLRRQSGFTLIELIVVIGTVPLLIGLLLPAIQKVREGSGRWECQNNLRQIGVAAQGHYDRYRAFPATLAEVLVAAKLPENGEIGGCKASSYVAGPNGWSVAMNPLPGVTGSETGHASGLPGQPAQIEFRPTPGADEARARMFRNIRAHAAIAVAQAFSVVAPGDQAKFSHGLKEWLSAPGAAGQAALPLQGTDGKVSLASIDRALAGVNFAMGDGSVRFVSQSVAGFWAAVKREMQLGAYGEKWQSLPGILAPRDGGSQTLDLFSYPSLHELTGHFVPNDLIAAQLRWYLTQAQAAAANRDKAGEQAALNAYLSGVASASTTAPPAASPIGTEALRSVASVSYPW